jgi:hypothetical protein
MPLINASLRERRNLGDQDEKLGLQKQASINAPSRLASKAAGQPLGTSYIPPLDLPTSLNSNMGGGSPTTPSPMQPGDVQTSRGNKRRPDTGTAAMTGK